MPESILTTTVTGCGSTVTYIWRKDGVQIGTNSSVVPIGPGLYTVEARCGTTTPACVDTEQITLSCEPMDVTITTGNGLISLSPAPNCTNYTSVWSFNGQNIGTSASIYPGLGNGTYTLTATCNDSTSQYSCTDTASYTCAVTTVITLNGNVLQGSANCPSTFRWYEGVYTIGDNRGALSTSANFTPPAIGTYSLVTTCTETGCIGIATYNYTVNCNEFQATFTTSGGQFNASSSQCSSLTYVWTYNGNPVGTGSSYVPNNGNGTYTVTVTCNAGTYDDCTDSNQFTCNVTLSLSQSGNTINSTVTGCGTYLYEWTGPAGFTATTPAIIPTVSGVYSLRVACVESGCVSQQVSIEYQNCNTVTVDLTFPGDNVIGYTASGCGSTPTIQWTITPPYGDVTTSSGSTIIVPVYEGDTTVQLSYTCKSCPAIIRTHVIRRRNVVYNTKNFPSNLVLKGLNISGTEYITTNFSVNSSSSSTNITPLKTQLDVAASVLRIPVNNITVSVAVNPLINTPCASTSGSVAGVHILFLGALTEGFNTANSFGPLEFDYTESPYSNVDAVIHPAYYVFNGTTRSLTKRTPSDPNRNFTVTVDPTAVYQGNPVQPLFRLTGFSLNILSSSCHVVLTSDTNLVTQLAQAQTAFNTFLSNNGGGTCTIQAVNSDTYVININNAVAPPNLIKRNLFFQGVETETLPPIYYNFTEL
jgi:hypothetical protein